MKRSLMHRPAHATSYYEDEKEIIRGPYDTYSSDYKPQEYATSGYPMGHRHNGEFVEQVTTVRYEDTPGYRHRHNGEFVEQVTTVRYEDTPGYRRHHHGDGAEYAERKEKIIYENDYEPYRRLY